MDFAVKNKANLSTPCIICQLGHKEQKSSLSCYSFDHIMEEKKCLGFELGSEPPHISFATVTSKHCSCLLFGADLQGYDPAFREQLEAPARAHLPGSQGAPRFYFRIEFTSVWIKCQVSV